MMDGREAQRQRGRKERYQHCCQEQQQTGLEEAPGVGRMKDKLGTSSLASPLPVSFLTLFRRAMRTESVCISSISGKTSFPRCSFEKNWQKSLNRLALERIVRNLWTPEPEEKHSVHHMAVGDYVKLKFVSRLFLLRMHHPSDLYVQVFISI